MENLLWPIFFICILFCSCNHLFYYPSKNILINPERVHLKYDNVLIKTEDGVKLNAWFLHAQNEKPIATIIHFHGNAENMTSHFLYFAWLAHLNFDVVDFDYRGYGLSTGKPNREGLVKDGLAIIKWVQENARNNEFFIIGQSLGGAVVIPSYVTGKVKNIQSIILDSTFASYRELARKKLGSIWLTWPLHWPLSFLISDELSSIDYIKEVDVPLLFIHSETDPVVPYESGLLLYEAARDPKELWKIPWPGHAMAFTTKDNQFRKDLIIYFCHHLKNKNNACDNLARNYKDPVLK